MAYRIPATKKEVKKAKGLYAAGYSVQDIAFELNRTGNTVRRMLHGFYDDLEPKPKQDSEEKPLWKICFDIEWTNTVNKLRKATGKEPI